MANINDDTDFLTQDFNLPSLPELPGAAPTLDHPIPDAISDTDVEKAKYFAGKIKYKNHGVRASMDLFLMNPSAHPAIQSTYFIDGIITSAPYHGSQE